MLYSFFDAPRISDLIKDLVKAEQRVHEDFTMVWSVKEEWLVL
jgi:hypothetical protein